MFYREWASDSYQFRLIISAAGFSNEWIVLNAFLIDRADPAFKNTRDAVAKSIALLEEVSPKFFPKSGCISCHNVSIPLMALNQARRFGYSIRPDTY